MKRVNCPFCNQVVYDNDKAGRIINGRGMFKTTILYHKDCYIKYYAKRIREEVCNENK